MKKSIVYGLAAFAASTTWALKYAAPDTVNVSIANQTPRIIEVYDRFGTTLIGPKKVERVALSTYGPATFTVQYAPVPTSKKPARTVNAAHMKYNEAGEIVQPVYALYEPCAGTNDVQEGDRFVIRGNDAKLTIKKG